MTCVNILPCRCQLAGGGIIPDHRKCIVYNFELFIKLSQTMQDVTIHHDKGIIP